MTINTMLFFAVIIVTFAMLFYSIAVIAEQRTSVVSRVILLFLTAGVFCDVTATILMIIGSRKIPLTVHGFIGYSALIVMLVDAILMWRLWLKRSETDVGSSLNVYTRLAYSWWVIAYIAGAIIAMTLKS